MSKVLRFGRGNQTAIYFGLMSEISGSVVWVTGAAGFIGFHLARSLVQRGYQVIGIDNLNDYYSVDLKRARLAELSGAASFRFFEADIVDKASLVQIAAEHSPRYIVNLAAQAG